MNIIEVAGHLGANPEERFTPSGQKVITLRLAATARKSGKEETVWWKAVIWGDRFDRMMPYLKKGSALIVIGEMSKPEIYNDREGKPQVSMELTVEMIRFSPFGGKGEKSGEKTEMKKEPAMAAAPQSTVGFSDDAISEDEIPF